MSSENVTNINVSLFVSLTCQGRGRGSSRVYVYTFVINNNNNNNIFSVLHFTGGLIVLLQHPAVLWQLVYITRCSSAKLPLLQDHMVVYYSS